MLNVTNSSLLLKDYNALLLVTVSELILDAQIMQQCDHFKYFGRKFVSGVDPISPHKRNFIRSCNTITACIHSVADSVIVQLVKSFRLPLIIVCCIGALKSKVLTGSATNVVCVLERRLST